MDEQPIISSEVQPSQTQNTLGETSIEQIDIAVEDTTETLKEKEQSRPGKKLISEAWLHFDQIKDENGIVTTAKCKYCKTVLSYKSSTGTSHLLRHARYVCPSRHLRSGIGQTQLNIKTEADGSTILELKEKEKVPKFDQDATRKDLVSMVVIHEYPLSMVDHIGFKKFVKRINPSFKMISRNILKSDIMKMYDDGNVSLKALFEYSDSKVAITTDMWTASNQKKGYMAVTSHFIDRQWILHNRTLRFCYIPSPHTAPILATVLMDCLSHYALENKISSVVLDNASTNDAMMSILKEKLEANFLMLRGEFLHLRCSAHILNLIVNDGLAVIGPAIEKARDCIVFWMSTPNRVEKFDEACRLLNISKPKKLVLDCKTRWNSTFLMLQAALPFKDIFTKLKRMNRKLNFVIPTEHDWMLASVVCEKLETFYKATKVFSGKNHPTSNLFFRKACEIKIALRRWMQSDVEIVRNMAKNMIEKFDKYWERISGSLAIAAILDPRNRMDCVEFYFKKLYGDDSEKEVKKIRETLDNLILEYQRKIESDKGQEQRGFVDDCDDEVDGYAQQKKTKKRKVNVRGEIEHYLDEDTLPENDTFDILDWWKRDLMYPTLRKIAKDILAIPVSSVASESAFSTGGRVVSSHRSRLHSKTVEALMCLQNWLIDDVKGQVDDPRACSTVTEDFDEDGEQIDIIDMDVDDVESNTNMEDLYS